MLVEHGSDATADAFVVDGDMAEETEQAESSYYFGLVAYDAAFGVALGPPVEKVDEHLVSAVEVLE